MPSHLSAVRISPVFLRWARADWARSTNRVPSSVWADELRRDPTLSQAIMVVDLWFGGPGGGRSVRVATVPLRSTAGDGSDHSAIGALLQEPELSASVRIGDGTSAGRSLTFSLDGAAVNPRALLASGMLLTGFGEVALELLDPHASEAVSLGYDDRIVLLRGPLDSPRFGAVPDEAEFGDLAGREIIEIEIADPRDLVQTRLPPWLADAARFPDIADSAVGAGIPVVLNGYARIPALRISTGTPATQTFVFAYGHGFSVDTATGVMVNGKVYADSDPDYAWALVEDADEFGVPYSAIFFSNAATAWDDSDAVHVTAELDERLSPIDVIRRICSDYSPISENGINARAFGESATRLPSTLASPNVIVNASAGGSAATVLSYIETGFLDSFPMISMVWEDGCYGPVVIDSRAEPVAELVAGALPLISRSSLLEASSTSDLANTFSIAYNFDIVQGVYRSFAQRGPDNSSICAYSDMLIGQIDGDAIESVNITEDATAEYVLDWLVAHKAMPSYLVEYDCIGGAFLTLRRGDPVRITDPDFAWVRARATVEVVHRSRGACTITLRVWANYVDFGGAAASVSV